MADNLARDWNSKNDSLTKKDLMYMTTQIVAAHISKNQVALPEIPGVIREVYQSLRRLDQESPATLLPRPEPAVPIDQSVSPDGTYIVCLEDGKKLQMLKRHLKAVYKMSIEEYKERWGLGPDYPVVSPNYAKRRSQIARKTGLGHTRRGSGMKMVTKKNEAAIVVA